jgi:hypothetical protein
MKTYGSLKRLMVVVLLSAASLGSAAVLPITSVNVDHPDGTPPYNLLSITVGNYTVTVESLKTGTTVGVADQGGAVSDMDNFDLNALAARNAPSSSVLTTTLFGGQKTWVNSNGDNPDFFLFEVGSNDNGVTVRAILPGGVQGQPITLPNGSTWGKTGLSRVGNPNGGQAIGGVCWAITDLKDASGAALTNGSAIEGLVITSATVDPSCLCAVVVPVVLAKNPSPANTAADVVRDVLLRWKPADVAKAHDVYFGTVFDSVNNASRTNPLGVLVSQAQDANTYDPPGLLALGQTYYWRIDEVEASSTITKGNIWSFTVEPVAYPIKNVIATASSSQNADTGPEKTVDSSGLTNDLHSTTPEHMWLSSPTGPTPTWIQYQFDKVYKLQEMWVWNSNQVVEGVLGVGAKDVAIEYSTDGTAWTSLTSTQFTRASGAAGYAHSTTVDLQGIAAKYVKLTIKSNWGGILAQFGLSEVRFFSVPVLAREPNPASGATGVNPQVTLSWRAGREAASHAVYVSTDQQAVLNGTAPMTKVVEPRYDASVDLGQSYYWKVVEVNEAQATKSWDGDVWSFSTANWIVVEDFESYTDQAGGEIFAAWIDGYGTTTNGAQVGYLQAPFAEKTIIHGNKQSMPLSYNNAGGITVSEAVRTFAQPQDWTQHGITTLVLYFYGDPANAGQLYVKINATKVVYTANANALKTPYWTQWNIDLAATGANLKAVTKLAMGVEGSGKGILYVDDIRLYRTAPAAATESLWIEAESGTLTKPMAIYNDATASGGKYISTENLGVMGAHTDGIATYPVTVKGGTYVVWGRVIDMPTGRNSFWVRIKGATLDTVPDADGWVSWNFPTTTKWSWDDVSNGANSLTDPAVHFTLKAGSYTLEIAYREDGARLDAIVITNGAN